MVCFSRITKFLEQCQVKLRLTMLVESLSCNAASLADVSTMETILRMVEGKYGKARRIWVFDRGIVSEENLAAIRKRGGQYLVGTPRSQMRQFEEELLKDDWMQVRPEVEVKKVAIPQGAETFILCRTEKEKSHSESLLGSHGGRLEAPGANHREGPFERSPQNGTAPGTHSSHPSAGERSL